MSTRTLRPESKFIPGAQIRWTDVTVPQGVDLVDEQLEAHGFTLADGVVLEGKVIDLATKQPIPARVLLQQRIGTVSEDKPTNYTLASQAVADAQGHWILKYAHGLASIGHGGGWLCAEGCRIRPQ